MRWDDGWVECWDYYCYYPWPVEVTVQSGSSVWIWLGPVLLFGASLVASLVSYVGIRASNKTNRESNETNRAAIAAADSRETARWRRETLLELSSDTVTAALDIRNVILQAPSAKHGPTIPDAELEYVEVGAKLLRDRSQHLQLIGADSLSEIITKIYTAAAEALVPMGELHKALVAMEKRVAADADQMAGLGAATPEELESMKSEVNAELVAEPRRKFDEAIAALNEARQEFIAEAQRLINSPIQTVEQASASRPPARREG